MRRVIRRIFPAFSEDQKMRNLYLGRPPGRDHELRFLWSIDTRHINSWILHGESLLFIWNLLMKTKPKNILEIGSGVSSLMFAKYASYMAINFNQHVSVNSIEHDVKWAKNTEELLLNENLEMYCKISVCPLGRLDNHGFAGSFYNLTTLKMGNIDFGLIDGPPESVGRQTALPSLLPILNEGALVVVDDTQRVDDYESIMMWKKTFPVSLRGLIPVGNGLGLFEIINQ